LARVRVRVQEQGLPNSEDSVVEFDIEDDAKGPRAANVVVTQAAPKQEQRSSGPSW